MFPRLTLFVAQTGSFVIRIYLFEQIKDLQNELLFDIFLLIHLEDCIVIVLKIIRFISFHLRLRYIFCLSDSIFTTLIGNSRERIEAHLNICSGIDLLIFHIVSIRQTLCDDWGAQRLIRHFPT